MKGKEGARRLAGVTLHPLYAAGLIGLIGLLIIAGCTGDAAGPQASASSPGPAGSGAAAGAAKKHAEELGLKTADSGSETQGGTAGMPDADDAVAVVGGKEIARSELMERLMLGYGAEVLRDLMLREAVAREAVSLGAEVTDEELDRELRKMSEGYGSEAEFYASMQRQLGMDRAAVREDARYHLLLEKLATWNVTIAEADIRKYYEDHPQEFGARIQYKLSWILLGTKDDSERVLGDLEKGADFSELAVQYSLDGATADEGGQLGWVDEGDPLQNAKLLAAAGELKAGEIAGPIQTDLGYAVLQMNGKKTLQGKAYDDVHEEIRRELAMAQAQSMQDLQRSLLAKYGAKVLDPRLVLPDAG